MARLRIVVLISNCLILALAVIIACILGFGSWLLTGWIVFLPLLIGMSSLVGWALAVAAGVPDHRTVGYIAGILAIPISITAWLGGTEVRFA